MALPNPIPDNPLRWDGWRNYNSPNLYHRLCLEFDGNVRPEIIEENTRLLLIWWQKKLPLKNQPSNPMAQILRQGLDEAAQFLAEARTKLLDPVERARHDAELHSGFIQDAIQEFRKLLLFSLAENTLSSDTENRLLTAGTKMGLGIEDMLPVIQAEIERTGSSRTTAEPIPEPVAVPPLSVPQEPSQPVTAALEQQAGDPEFEFRKLLKMSRLCLDGEDMTDDQRDAMCNLGESLGLTGGDAEDLIDEYLEQMANLPLPPTTPSATPRIAHQQPPALSPQKKATQPLPAPAPSPANAVINLSPLARAEEKKKNSNYTNSLGMEMYLVPSGRFEMGSNGSASQASEQPVTPVLLSGLFMSRYPVTNLAYERFDSAHRTKKRATWANDHHPVVYVSATEAEAFCKWLSQKEGKKYRLPTEAEWEFAARGPSERTFPWGDDFGKGQNANFADARTAFLWREATIDDGFSETSPVGCFPKGASAYGIEDMAGNVFEWCLDSFDLYKGKEVTNPRNIQQSPKRVYRGGSWKSRISSLRCCSRSYNLPNYQSNDVGFRIVCEIV